MSMENHPMGRQQRRRQAQAHRLVQMRKQILPQQQSELPLETVTFLKQNRSEAFNFITSFFSLFI